MVVGTLYTEIVLDEPGKVHRGPHDPVLGHVNITYIPKQKSNTAAELFGPLSVSVILHGRAKTKISNNRDPSSVSRGRAPLISKTVVLYDDPIKLQSGDTTTLPFSVTFPEFVNAKGKDRFTSDPRFASGTEQPLPPSCRHSHVTKSISFDTFVEYRIGVDVLTPQLHVRIIKPSKDEEPIVHYESPLSTEYANSKPYIWSDTASVSNELLLPEPDRPAGFRQKTKALLGAGNFPTYAFDWTCTGPRDIYLNAPLAVQIRINPRLRECTAPLVPEVRLHSIRISVRAHLHVRSSASLFSFTQDAQICRTLWTWTVSCPEPFCKGDEFTKDISTQVLSKEGMSDMFFHPSFSTQNIALTHSLRLDLAFEVAGRIRRFGREVGVVLREGGMLEREGEGLPAYEPAPPYEVMEREVMEE